MDEKSISFRSVAGRYHLASFHSDIFESDINIIIFPYGKVSDRVLRRLTGLDELEYERSYVCYGSVYSNDDDCSETLVLQRTKDGKVYFSCAGHELFHLVTNLFARIHQKIDAGEGGDAVAAQTMGTLSNRLYLLMNRYGIRFTEG